MISHCAITPQIFAFTLFGADYCHFRLSSYFATEPPDDTFDISYFIDQFSREY